MFQILTIYLFNKVKNIKYMDSYIPICSDSDNFDIDNKFITIRRSNLQQHLDEHNCKNENELEDMLWYNFGLTIKIV